MQSVTDEILMAYADGELTSDEATALEARLRQDAGLRARLEPFVETRRQLASAFEPMLHDPIPERLLAAIARAPIARPSPRAPSLLERIRDFLSASAENLFPSGLTPAMAASVAALVAIGAAGAWLGGRTAGSSELVVASGPDLIASGTLADALERKPSGTATPAGNAGTTVTPVLSFGSKQNGVCREYRIAAESGPSFAGLACRKDEGIWRVAIHVETPKQAPVEGGYQTATGTSVPVVEALVDTMISGAAFGPEEEAAMLKQDWRTSP